MRRVAAVDCGTNSIRLLIVEAADGASGAERLREITRVNTIVRLGQGVDATGRLNPEAIERTRAALEGYVDTMEAEGVEAVRMVATSATRDASNREEFFSMTAELLGRIQPRAVAEVVTGEEEAELSFAGATSDLPADRGPFCVIDLGGGSTEFIVGRASGGEAFIEGAYSTQMGCVRLTERIMTSDPATGEETEEARGYVDKQIAVAGETVPLEKATTYVGCAGTFTTLAALTLGLDSYDPERIHMAELPFDRLREVTAELRAMTAAQRAENPVIHGGRADVIGSGAVVVEQLMETAEKAAGVSSFVVSEKDILDGIVAGLL